MDDGVYLRRVSSPNPIFQQLAADACEGLRERYGGHAPMFAIIHAATAYGVPLTYLLDEIERRVREGLWFEE